MQLISLSLRLTQCVHPIQLSIAYSEVHVPAGDYCTYFLQRQNNHDSNIFSLAGAAQKNSVTILYHLKVKKPLLKAQAKAHQIYWTRTFQIIMSQVQLHTCTFAITRDKNNQL